MHPTRNEISGPATKFEAHPTYSLRWELLRVDGQMIEHKMSQNRSRRHHYLPQCYLKGFTDEGGYYVYDKQNDEIISQKLTPRTTFFETDLNTITYPNGDLSDELEKFYAEEIERDGCRALKKVRESPINTTISWWKRFELYTFLSSLRCRLPHNIPKVQALAPRAFADDPELDFFNMEYTSGRAVPEEMKSKIRESDSFKKHMRVVAPLAPFHRGDAVLNAVEQWRFIFTGDGNDWFFIGDNPFIDAINNFDPVDPLNGFILPISGGILLTDMEVQLDQFKPEVVTRFNAAIIDRSTRFVACANRKLLEMTLDMYKETWVKFDRTADIVTDIFSMLKE